MQVLDFIYLFLAFYIGLSVVQLVMAKKRFKPVHNSVGQLKENYRQYVKYATWRELTLQQNHKQLKLQQSHYHNNNR